MEIWKPIEESLHYAISSHGRIKRLEHGRWCVPNKSYSRVKEKILKPSNKNTKGYWRIKVWYSNGTQTMESIHRLVAEAFIPNPEGLPQVNHEDGNKDNNHYKNLKWCTNQENMDHAITIGLMTARIDNIRGEKSHLNKYNEDTIRRIPELINAGYSYRTVAKMLQIPPTLISEIKMGRCWTHLNLQIPESSKYKKKQHINL